jgi:hypothetical protein
LRARAKADSEHRRMTIFQRYIPEVAAALANILGKEKEPIAKTFEKTLSNFVNMLEVSATEEAAANEGNPPPSMPPPEGGGSNAPPAAAAAPSDKKSAEKKSSKKAPEKAEKPVKKTKRGKTDHVALPEN